MTNAEIYKMKAIENYDNLPSYKKKFIDDVIRNASKKDLQKLTSKQYFLLRKCVN